MDPSGQFMQISSTLKFQYFFEGGLLPELGQVYVGTPYSKIPDNGMSQAEQFSKASNFIVLSDTDTYSIAVPSYIAGGGDGYTMLDKVNMTKTGYGISSYEVTAAFLGTVALNEPGVSLDDQQSERIVQIGGEESIGQSDCSCLQNQRHTPTNQIRGNVFEIIISGKAYDVPIS